MTIGHLLVKEQLFFRRELRERVCWLIKLRWIAVAGGFGGSISLYLADPNIPVLPLIGTILTIFFYNILFFFIWLQLKTFKPYNVRPFEIFAHTQITFDLISLFFIIFFTGGIRSPLLIFTIFHIILAGILLSPSSCFIYSSLVVIAFGGLILLQQNDFLKIQPVLFQNIVVPFALEFPAMLFLILAAFIMISAFLITSIKSSLRTKGRELLRISKELDRSNTKLRTLYDMVKQMGSLYDLQSLIECATRNGVIIMGVKGCSIKLFDGQRKTKLSSLYGLIEDSFEKEGIGVENSVVCLPLCVDKIVSGRFCIYSHPPDSFEQEDVDFFSLMADLTALGIDKITRELDKKWFLTKAAHQLRSPLNAIYSMLDLVHKGYLGPINQEQRGTMERCEARIKILGETINDLLKIGNRRSQRVKEATPRVDVKEVLENLITLYLPRASEKGIDFKFNIDGSVPEIGAERQLLDDLFSNLISNAIKYTPPQGTVTVVLSVKNGDHIQFQVTDTGIGIPDQDLSAIFSEFFRSENAKAFTENGTGLGLIIVKEALDLLKGSIDVESKIGEGSSFTCLFPGRY